MKREELLNIIDAACVVARWEYAQAVAQALLAVWPNDLAAQRGLARALAQQRPDTAIERLRKVVAADGQDADALALLGRLLADQGHAREAELMLAAALAMRPDDPALQANLQRWPAWLYPALRARRALEVGNPAAAFQAMGGLLDARDGDELAAHPAPWLTLLEAAWRAARWAELRAVSARVRSRWPDAVLPDVVLGAALMRDGQYEQGAAMMHNAAVRDPAGQVSCRLWGAGHPYRSLWPEPLDLPLPAMLPGDVAAVLGRNRLHTGADGASQARVEVTPEPVRGTSAGKAMAAAPELPAGAVKPRLRVLDTQARGQDGLAMTPTRFRSALGARRPGGQARPASREQSERYDPSPDAEPDDDGRDMLEALQSDLEDLAEKIAGAKGLPVDVPMHEVHVIVSHYGSLVERFGAETAVKMEKLLRRLGRATEANTGLMTDVIFVDRADTLSGYELEPCAEATPEAVKGLLAAIDGKLAEDKAVIASVLIVGDDAVIPFFRLPNPVEDHDAEIYTDAPYAARGEDTLAGERAVGRFPQADLQGLVNAVKHAIAAHRQQPRRGVFPGWRELVRRLLRRPPMPTRSFGYTASVWRSAAEDVYGVIGRVGALRASPPSTSADCRLNGLGAAGFSYFNLHGLNDAPCWYGQRAPTESMYPDFPIALGPDDVMDEGRAPRVVFSAACYGASVNGKSSGESIALRFLECGTLGFVGSTVISYGSVERPLVGADLLARRFWERLASGYAQGFALRDAKRQFASEMQNRQGYLDTEDHKTLVSFVLYGDPTLHPEPIKRRSRSKGLAGQPQPTALPDVTLAEPLEPAPVDTVSNEVVQRVKGLVAPFVPGVHEAELSLARPRAGAACAMSKQGKTLPAPSAVLTLRKAHQIDATHTWRQIAHVAVTESGHVMKVLISK